MTRTVKQQSLKETLQSFHDFKQVSQQEAITLSDQMVDHIGNPDPVLRDELIYSGLATWIMEGKFDKQYFCKLFNQVLTDQYLFYKIGQKDDDSVFTRSFSVLLLPPIIEVHKKDSFLSKEELFQGLEAVTAYLKQEKDVRGYVPEKGWAHSIAHAADALESFASLDEIEEQHLIPSFEAIKTAISRNIPYHHGEDERLIHAIETMLPKVPDCFFIEWIQSFENILDTVESPEDSVVHFNVKTFLRSLYFRFVWKKEERYRDAIVDTLESIDKIGAY